MPTAVPLPSYGARPSPGAGRRPERRSKKKPSRRSASGPSVRALFLLTAMLAAVVVIALVQRVQQNGAAREAYEGLAPDLPWPARPARAAAWCHQGISPNATLDYWDAKARRAVAMAPAAQLDGILAPYRAASNALGGQDGLAVFAWATAVWQAARHRPDYLKYRAHKAGGQVPPDEIAIEILEPAASALFDFRGPEEEARPFARLRALYLARFWPGDLAAVPLCLRVATAFPRDNDVRYSLLWSLAACPQNTRYASRAREMSCRLLRDKRSSGEEVALAASALLALYSSGRRVEVGREASAALKQYLSVCPPAEREKTRVSLQFVQSQLHLVRPARTEPLGP